MLVGYLFLINGATVENCSADGSIKYIGSGEGSHLIAGFIGVCSGSDTTSSTIENCNCSTNVSGNTSFAYFFGTPNSENLTIENCNYFSKDSSYGKIRL